MRRVPCAAITGAPAERLDVLDGLRGIAILLVVWYHAWLITGQGIALVNFVAEAGFLGVDLFFFISGFCLFYPYARAAVDGRALPGTRRFFARRAIKIVPSYFLALSVFAIVYRDRFATPHDAFTQLASHLAFVHTLNPATYGGISGPLWTIGVEVQFYLIFPLIARAFRRRPVLTYCGLVALAESYRVALGLLGLDTTFWWFNQLPAYIDVFGAGMLASYALVVLRERGVGAPQRTITAVSGGAFLVCVAALFAVSRVARSADISTAYACLNAARILIGPLCIVLALATSLAVRPWRALVCAPVLVFFSVISYNLYLWNLEVAVWFKNAALPSGAAFAGSMVTAIALASAITFAFERPLLNARPDTLKGRLAAWQGTAKPAPSRRPA